jgi:hypothetical protein
MYASYATKHVTYTYLANLSLTFAVMFLSRLSATGSKTSEKANFKRL